MRKEMPWLQINMARSGLKVPQIIWLERLLRGSQGINDTSGTSWAVEFTQIQKKSVTGTALMHSLRCFYQISRLQCLR